tara:strand:+ start:1846 stop:2172 length:327 start_codon:yes stop_codon:yes gene_type:complete
MKNTTTTTTTFTAGDSECESPEESESANVLLKDLSPLKRFFYRLSRPLFARHVLAVLADDDGTEYLHLHYVWPDQVFQTIAMFPIESNKLYKPGKGCPAVIVLSAYES